jgi:hypothetical protein
VTNSFPVGKVAGLWASPFVSTLGSIIHSALPLRSPYAFLLKCLGTWGRSAFCRPECILLQNVFGPFWLPDYGFDARSDIVQLSNLLLFFLSVGLRIADYSRLDWVQEFIDVALKFQQVHPHFSPSVALLLSTSGPCKGKDYDHWFVLLCGYVLTTRSKYNRDKCPKEDYLLKRAIASIFNL